jgi:NAD(P)-dependent dehydrogenase (short-subunit alcohol dehydrogenase family)
MSTLFITGCSTGLGRALAEAVVEAGHQVVATARDPGSLDPFAARRRDLVLELPLDVTDHAQVADAVARAEQRFGGIDVLVNNAGYGYRAAVEEGDEADVARLFDTNFFGPVALIKAVLPGMRARRSGTIVNISSIGAGISPPGSGYYAATKAALEAMTASLRKEVGPHGIRAISVEPGGFRTDFAGRSLAQSEEAIDAYADTSGRRRKEVDRVHGTQQGDPARAARALLEVVASDAPPALLVLGPDAVHNFGAALDALRFDLEAWEATSRSTSYPDAS